LLLAALVTWSRSTLLTRAELWLHCFAAKPYLPFIAIMALALIPRASLLPWIPVPAPAYHDEWSYLLAADTFASGRLTNPTPPCWIHFESFHINLIPTYQSMYPPAQGMFLAAGKWLFDSAWLGVWLSMALMCIAILWALQGWVPRYWAFLAALFCVLRFGLFSYWIDSYWGGAIPAFAGALVYGALPRLLSRQKARYGVVFALGLALLAASRPLEGLLFSVPALVLVVVWISHKRFQSLSAIAPGVVVMLVALSALAYYNWRGTGHALQMPYLANLQQYHVTRPFFWQSRGPAPEFHHAIMRVHYFYWELPAYLTLHSPGGWLVLIRTKLVTYVPFFLWPMSLLFLPAYVSAWRSRRMRPLAWAGLLTGLGALVQIWPAQPHYMAPALVAILGIMVYGLRMLRTWKPRGRPFGQVLVQVILLALLLGLGARTVIEAIDPFHLGMSPPVQLPYSIERASLAAKLQRLSGQQLVLVRERAGHDTEAEWVYNGAGLASEKVLWARDMGWEANEELIRNFPGRTVWLLDPDIVPLLPHLR
ncbi:MAG: hypothetical protein ABSD20_21030, partial [Terriglobales bacterium]